MPSIAPIDRASPHSTEAERAVLGSILLDNPALYTALDRISVEDFFSTAHRLIIQRMCDLAGHGRTIDLVTICDELAKHGEVEKAGGGSYIAALTDGVPAGSTASVLEYCRIVKEKSTLRRLINASQNVVARCLENADEVADLIELAHTQILDIEQGQNLAASGPQPINEIVAQAIPVLEKTSGSGIILGAKTGFPALDKYTAGWQEGEYVVLAGRPSLGKSALAMDFTIRACEAGVPVGVFSLEMSKRSLLIRLACRLGKVDSQRVRFGWMNREEWKEFSGALGRIASWPLWIDDTPGLSIDQLKMRIRSLAQRSKPRMVIVDHLQIVCARAENRTQEITKVSNGLQRAARELGRISQGTLIAVSQLNRLGAGDEPQLIHLRESGSIEQDCDVAMFLWDRVKAELGDPSPQQRVLKIGKQRNGPTGYVNLVFLPQWVGFEEGTAEQQSAARDQARPQVPSSRPRPHSARGKELAYHDDEPPIESEGGL